MRAWAVALSTTIATACGNAPTRPNAVTLVASRPLTPANNANVPNSDHGGTRTVTLTASASVTTGAEPITYTFFVSKLPDLRIVEISRHVTAAAGTDPSITFQAETTGDYYWRVQASSGSVLAPMSETFRFVWGSGVTIQSPKILGPDNGSVVPIRPTLRFERPSFVGKPAALCYGVVVSASPSFAPVVWSSSGACDYGNPPSSVLEFPVPPGSELATNTTYYWRVSAYDTDNESTPGGPSSTATFVTESRGLLRPTVAAPPYLSPTTLRPTLVVNNAPHVGQASAVVYRFEFSTDSLFRSIAASGTTPETPGQTAFTPSFDLPSDGVLYWHATAIDLATGETSPPSLGSNIVPHRPTDHLYTLTVHLPDDCPTSFDKQYLFDGHLQWQGNAAQFAVSSNGEYYDSSFVASLTRAGETVSGRLAVNDFRDRLGYPVTVFERTTNHEPVQLHGGFERDGSIAGSFDGLVTALHISFGLRASYCVGRFPWTITASTP